MGPLSGWLFETARFIPHGVCLLWRPDLVALHVVSDAVIAASYFAIPIAIFVFARKRFDLEPEHRRMALLFVAFITACGLTHVAGIVTLWWPLYGLQGLIKGLTAVISVLTAAALPMLVPRLLSLPSSKVLQAANDSLATEVAAHQATLQELRVAQAELARQLADRDEDLRIANHRFTTALTNSPITVFEQDADLRYTWIYNPPPGIHPDQLIGRDERDAMGSDSAEQLRELKREALAAREPRQAEVKVVNAVRTGWFDIRVQPTTLRNGEAGLVASAIDITPRMQHQAELQLVMRELNHRSKNLLTIVQSIARQSASGLTVPKAYLGRLGDRLQALAKAHDVLVQQNWLGADLRSVIESQLRPHLDSGAARLRLDGAPFELSPNVAHYVGLAIHELGANAAKYGALSNDDGEVDVSWAIETEADGARSLRLEWRETGGPEPKERERRGFGRIILEVLTPQALQGAADLRFEEAGMVWTLRARLGAEAA